MIGSSFAKRYRIDAELGRGGMGVVYRAHDTLLQRDVVVKVLGKAGDSALNTEARERLLNEARAAARLNHAHIVSVYDAGEVDDQPYIVMELVDGASLQEQRPATFEEIISTGKQICTALAHAHQHGIVHRDLKPGNVLIGKDGTVKLADFGLARSVASHLTEEGSIVGTILYLPPEQAMGKPIDGRADLYALGAMLYELTTGRLPFVGDSPVAVISQHLYAPVVPPSTFRPDLPAGLERIILRLLAKNPDDRYASANELLHRLSELEMESKPALPVFVPESDTTDTVLLLEKLVRGRLVGRQAELEQLRDLWKHARNGNNLLVLISGEPGVGKTRLAHEVIVYARLGGAAIWQGGCYEYEAATPYLPIVEALRAWVREQNTEALRLQLGALAPELAKLAPEIESRIGRLAPNPSLPASEERLRLFDHVTRFIHQLAGERGLLFFLDDLHWVDQGTLALLHYLLRNLRGVPMMILAAYREVELDRNHPLADALVEWNRERLAMRLPLGRLSRRDVSELLASLFGIESVSDEFMDAIYSETEGNPFFVEEVVKSLIQQGQIYRQDGRWQRHEMEHLTIPQSVKEAIGRRLGRLSKACMEVLHTAAVLGRRFPFRELVFASQGDEEELLDAIDEAVMAQLLQAEPRETFTFTHDKIREVLYEELNPIRRRRLHKRVAEGLERLLAEPASRSGLEAEVQDLAYHFIEGDELEKGLDYSVQAAEKACRLYAHEEALCYYEQAVDCAESLEREDMLVSLYRAIGQVYVASGEAAPAVENFKRALEFSTLPEQRAELAVHIGETYMIVGDERGMDFLRGALDELDSATQTDLLARAIASIGRFHHYHGEWEQVIEYLQRALQLAEPLGQADTLTWIYGYLSGAYQQMGKLEESLVWARRCIELGERLDYPLAIALGYEFLAEDATWVANWRQTLEYGRQEVEIAEKIGSRGRLGWAQASMALAYHRLGEIEQALASAETAISLAEYTSDKRLEVLVRTRRAVMYSDLEDDLAAQADIDFSMAYAQESEQIQLISWCYNTLGDVYARCGEWQKLLEVTGQFEAQIGGKRYDWRVPAAIGLGDIQELEKLVAEARRLDGPVDMAAARAFRAQLWGRAYAALQQWEQAEQRLDEAISIMETMESPLDLGFVLFARARLWLSMQRRQEGCQELERARRLFADCGAVRYVHNIEQVLQTEACSKQED
ncbi:MAG: protein kinase [Chloroflexota bacterium]